MRALNLTLGLGGNQDDSASPFVPTALSGCVLWLRADRGITLNGSGVMRWTDQSGNGNDVVQNTAPDQPTVTASAIGGKPALAFNGTSQYLENSAFSITSPLTIFAVAQYAAVGGVEMVFSCSSGGASYWDSSTSDTGEGFYFNGIQVNVVVPEPGAAFVGTGLMDGTVNSFYRNNGVQVNALSTNGTVSNLQIGAFSASDFNGKFISEFIVYNRALVSGDISKVWTYLEADYGISP